MNKRIPFFFTLLFLSASLWSQISINVTPNEFVLNGNPTNTDVNIHIEVTNTSGIDANIAWSRVVENPPAGWLTWICDKNLCYVPTANASSPSKPNILAPGEKMDFQIHVNPYNIEGCTAYDVTFTDWENPEIILGHISGEVCINSTVSTQSAGSSSTLTVYPNPTEDYFQISETPGLRYVQLFNIVGNKIKSFDAVPQKQYYVGDLTDGMYLVRLMTSTGKIIKTIRLSKR